MLTFMQPGRFQFPAFGRLIEDDDWSNEPSTSDERTADESNLYERLIEPELNRWEDDGGPPAS